MGREKVRATTAQARQQARHAASQVSPYATTARANARRGMHTARSWAAPRLDRSGRALQERVAPKMSAMLRSAARRVEPPRAKRRRWPFMTAALVMVAGAASAAAGLLSKRGQDPFGRKAQEEAAGTQTEQATTSADANGRVHTS
jgi:hypothetical protein